MVEITGKILYFDTKPERNRKNIGRLFGKGNTGNSYQGHKLVVAERPKDTPLNKGAGSMIEREEHAVYVIHAYGEGHPDVLDTILLASAEKGVNPRIGIIYPGKTNGLVDEIMESANGLGIIPLIEVIECPPNGIFQGTDCKYATQGRKTLKKLLGN